MHEPSKVAGAIVFALASALAFPSTARADNAPTSTASSGYSHYEQESIDAATTQLHTEVDPLPEGKPVEDVEVVTLEVLEDRDPLPAWASSILNALHATTRPKIVRRELLLRTGEAFSKATCDETARNLKARPQLSLVLCTAIRGKKPGTVRVLVITKDVWSLRLGYSLVANAGGLESLLVQPSETNVAGTHQTILGRFTLDPESYSVGLGFRAPRLQGHWLQFAANAAVIVNRNSGHAEGSYGDASIGRPLFSTKTEWGWGVGVSWRDEVARRFVNARLARFDATSTPEIDKIPYQYKTHQFTEAASVTRSYGWATKNDFTAGAEMNVRLYRTFDLGGFNPAASEEFVRKAVPVSDTRVGPFIQYRGYSTNYLRVLDFETLGLQEDFRVGHDVYLRVYPVAEAFGSSRTFVGTYAAAQYTIPFGDGLVRAAVESTTEAEADRLSDAAVGGTIRLITPRLGFGRILYEIGALNRYRNYLNRLSFLGGDGRLRGYPSSYFVGKDVFVSNLEFRSRPIEILRVQLGLAAFYDIGQAFDGFDHMKPRQTVGFGFRSLIPQLNRVVFRADVGFPLLTDRPASVPPAAFVISFEQAFPVPVVGNASAQGPASSSATGFLGQ